MRDNSNKKEKNLECHISYGLYLFVETSQKYAVNEWSFLAFFRYFFFHHLFIYNKVCAVSAYCDWSNSITHKQCTLHATWANRLNIYILVTAWCGLAVAYCNFLHVTVSSSILPSSCVLFLCSSGFVGVQLRFLYDDCFAAWHTHFVDIIQFHFPLHGLYSYHAQRKRERERDLNTIKRRIFVLWLGWDRTLKDYVIDDKIQAHYAQRFAQILHWSISFSSTASCPFDIIILFQSLYFLSGVRCFCNEVPNCSETERENVHHNRNNNNN